MLHGPCCFYARGINSCSQLDGYCFISAMKKVSRNQQKIKVFAWCMSKWAKDYFITEGRANEQLFGDLAPARYFNVLHESFWNLSLFFFGDFLRILPWHSSPFCTTIWGICLIFSNHHQTSKSKWRVFKTLAQVLFAVLLDISCQGFQGSWLCKCLTISGAVFHHQRMVVCVKNWVILPVLNWWKSSGHLTAWAGSWKSYFLDVPIGS